MSLFFNMLSRLVIAFLPRSKHPLISWLQSPSAVILEPKKIKSLTVSIVSPSIYIFPHLYIFKNLILTLEFSPVFLPGEFHGQGSLGEGGGYNTWDHQELDLAEKVVMCREGNGTPLQYSGLENPMDGGAW